jgi:hypothetical protein
MSSWEDDPVVELPERRRQKPSSAPQQRAAPQAPARPPAGRQAPAKAAPASAWEDDPVYQPPPEEPPEPPAPPPRQVGFLESAGRTAGAAAIPVMQTLGLAGATIASILGDDVRDQVFKRVDSTLEAMRGMYNPQAGEEFSTAGQVVGGLASMPIEMAGGMGIQRGVGRAADVVERGGTLGEAATAGTVTGAANLAANLVPAHIGGVVGGTLARRATPMLGSRGAQLAAGGLTGAALGVGTEQIQVPVENWALPEGKQYEDLQGETSPGIAAGLAGAFGVHGAHSARAARIKTAQQRQQLGLPPEPIDAYERALAGGDEEAAMASRSGGTMGSVGSAGTEMETQRRMRAGGLPVPIALTRGQATRQHTQQQFERETAKDNEHGGPLREHFDEQNQRMSQNFDAWMDETGAETADTRGTGQSVDTALTSLAERRKAEIRAAYEEARAAGHMAEEVSTEALAQLLDSRRPEAINAPVIDSVRAKLVQLGGASQDADGNLVSGTLPVNDLEEIRKMINRVSGSTPTNQHFGEEMKRAIDGMTDDAGGDLYRNARALRSAYGRDFRDRAVVRKLVENKAGMSKGDRQVALEDVFKHSVLSSSLDDVQHLHEILQSAGEPGQQAWRDLQGQTLRHLQEQATSNVARDQRGNPIVSAAKLDKAIRALDADGKLEFIFGRRGAEQLRDLNDIAKDVLTSPPGSVNHSNTASALRNMVGDMALMAADATGFPYLTIGKQIKDFLKNRATTKRVRQALAQPEAGQPATPAPRRPMGAMDPTQTPGSAAATAPTPPPAAPPAPPAAGTAAPPPRPPGAPPAAGAGAPPPRPPEPPARTRTPAEQEAHDAALDATVASWERAFREEAERAERIPVGEATELPAGAAHSDPDADLTLLDEGGAPPRGPGGAAAAAPEGDAQGSLFSRAGKTDTPEFKGWFGKSKVVDKEGQPLVVYHGTSRDFNAFDPKASMGWRRQSVDTVGSWFSNEPGRAAQYAGGEGHNVMPVHLAVSKPKVYKSFLALLDDMHKSAGRDPKKVTPRGIGSTDELRAKLKAQGYDGIRIERSDVEGLQNELKEVDERIREEVHGGADDWFLDGMRDERKVLVKQIEKYRGSTEFDGHDVWIAFDPHQIKSAIGNKGTYDKDNPDMRFSRAGKGKADEEPPAAKGKAAAPTPAPAATKERTAETHTLRVERNERVRGTEATFTPAEEAALAAGVAEHGVDADAVRATIVENKLDHPPEDGWAPLEVTGVKEVKDPDTGEAKIGADGKPVVEPKYQVVPYSFDKGEDGKTIPKTVTPEGKNPPKDERGKVIKERNPVYDEHVSKVGQALAEEVRKVLQRAKAGNAAAKKIIAQAGWYKQLRSRLRHEFGGLGDLFADLLGATSPNTPVRTNWDNTVEALRRAQRGDFDELMPKWVEWADAIDAGEAEFRRLYDSKIPTEAQIDAMPDVKAAEAKLAEVKKMKRGAPGRAELKDAAEKELRQVRASKAVTKKTVDAMPDIMAMDERMKALRELPDELLPTKENDRKYGFNGRNVVRALVDLWRVVKDADPDIGRGATAPKAVNFSGNLIGFKPRATIDVWAARLLQRITGGLRIPSTAEAGVSGAMRASGETTLQFGMGQDIFSDAVARIRSDPEMKRNRTLANINDDDLQAVVWFLEKEHWTKNNWTSAAGEGGSFEFEADLAGIVDRKRVAELRRTADSKNSTDEERAKATAELTKIGRTVDRAFVGVSLEKTLDTHGIEYVPTSPEQAAAAAELHGAINELPGGRLVIASKAAATRGSYLRKPETAIDGEVISQAGYDHAPLARATFTVAKKNDQDAAFVARVLRDDEEFDPLRHRPGVEIYFREMADLARAQEIVNKIHGKGVEAMTVIVDGRRSETLLRGEVPPAVGVRFLYLPEFVVRYKGENPFAKMNDAELAAHMEAKADELAQLAAKIAKQVKGVNFGAQFDYEVETRFGHEYQEAIDAYSNREGEAADQAAGGRPGAWSGRSVRDALEGAVGQLAEVARAQERRAVRGHADLGGDAGGQDPAQAGRFSRAGGSPGQPGQPAGGAQAGELPGSGVVRGGPGVLAWSRRPDQGLGGARAQGQAGREVDGSLRGLPRQVGGFTASAWEPAQDAARKYMAKAGHVYTPPSLYVPVNSAHATRIADAWSAMEHAPNDPVVRRAYEAMVEQTQAQFEAVLATGLKIEFITGNVDPYAASPRLMTEDVRNNNHMWVFRTSDGFGSSADFSTAGNPLLVQTPFKIGGVTALANDLFRVVHDFFGHVKEGVGFRADGEDNAWRSHYAMYTGDARRAMTSETRGQNSWVNYGPNGATNRTASTPDTVFADQKVGLLPEWTEKPGGLWSRAGAAPEGAPTGRARLPTEALPEGLPARPFKNPAELEASLRNTFGNKLIDGLVKQGILHMGDAPTSIPRDVRGWFTGKRVELYHDRLDGSSAASILMHEMGSHYGMPRMLGEARYNALLGDIAKLKGTSPEVAKVWKTVVERYVDVKDHPLVEGSPQFLSEVAAHLVETQPNRPIVKRMVDAARAYFYKEFGVNLGTMDPHLLRALTAAALRKAGAGVPAAPAPRPRVNWAQRAAGLQPNLASLSRTEREKELMPA